MNIEIMQLKSKLAERKNRFRELDMDVSNLMIAVRNHLDPYEDDVTKLKTDKALQAMKELDSAVIEMKGLKVKIEEMERDLK